MASLTAASKTVAERAFWDGVRGKNYDGVAINPSLVSGVCGGSYRGRALG